MIKSNSLRRKQNKKLPKNNEKINGKISAGVFKIIK